ncbi:MAG: phosphotransferase enzyme family protein [Acutalibacteraceae bacterium]
MQLSDAYVHEILSHFDLPGTLISYRPIGCGHINDTLMVTYRQENSETGYILQRINTNVFRNPDQLMENVHRVTAYLADVIRKNGGDPARETLTVYPTKEGERYYRTATGDCMRVYNFVADTYTLQSIENPDDFRKAGAAFGNFQCMLADYPSKTLHETIPDFHNTVSRFEALKTAIAEDAAGRAAGVQTEIDFALAREADTHVLLDLLKKGELPLRVTHNDTKLNNILFDNTTRQGLCVVDLDTVMPGLSLYDFGDSIRFGANTADEDEKDVSKVSLSLDLYRAYVEGYLSTAGSSLTDREIEYLPFSAKLLTYECGIRFLTDYLNGDTYFHTAYPEHNLIRCRTQFALVADMERKMSRMQSITAEAAAKLCKKEVSPCC